MKWQCVVLLSLVGIARAVDYIANCNALCGALNLQCVSDCVASLKVKPTVVRDEDTIFDLELISKVPTLAPITGSDQWHTTKTGKLYFTTLDGGLWKLVPRPLEGVEVLKKIYQMSNETEFYATGDRGLYDISFPRNFTLRRFYMSYSALPTDFDYTHNLRVGEFTLSETDEVQFLGVIEDLPQVVPYRSGGFLKSSRSITPSRPQYLWLSSGGNQEFDRQLLQSEPRYSSIYSVCPPALQSPSVVMPQPTRYWATGMENPYECDYMTTEANVMCLSHVRDADNKVSRVTLITVPRNYSGFEDIAGEWFETHGDRYSFLNHSIMIHFDPERECVPETIMFSKFNDLGISFRKTLLIAHPVCSVDGFAGNAIQALVRDSINFDFVVRPLRIDFGGHKLWNIQLLGAEKSNGVFLSGRDLRSNEHLIFLIKRI